jgi:hypothetical protein
MIFTISVTSGSALVQCISQRKNRLHNPFQLGWTTYLWTSWKKQEMYKAHDMASKFELISSSYLFCTSINNIQVLLKVKNLKIVLETINIMKPQQNFTVENNKRRNRLHYLWIELDLEWENSHFRLYTWYFHKLHEELSHPIFSQNRMLIVCVLRNQIYTHTVQKMNTELPMSQYIIYLPNNVFTKD